MARQGVQVERQNAEPLHAMLLGIKMLDFSRIPVRTETHIIFPLLRAPSREQKARLLKAGRQKGALLRAKNPGEIKFVRAEFRLRGNEQPVFTELLRKKLTKLEMKKLRKSFDTIGDIAVIEIAPELAKKEKIIASALLASHRNINVVCKQSGAHKGKFRIQPVKILAGERRLCTVHRESGCEFEIELGKTYFSPRLGTERLRIAKQIKAGEVVGALFAGAGPFPIVFAKNSQMEKAYAVELNPDAYSMMLRNISRNNVSAKVEPILGDVRKVAPARLAGKCDRVVMPLPKGAETFLHDALLCLKPKGGIVHFYQFSDIKEPFKEPLEKIRAAAKALGKKVRVLSKHRVRSYSPEIVQVVVDFWAAQGKKEAQQNP